MHLFRHLYSEKAKSTQRGGLRFFLLCRKRREPPTGGFPEGSEPTAAGGGSREASEWQRSKKSRESVSPKIFSGTATGRRFESSSRKQIE